MIKNSSSISQIKAAVLSLKTAKVDVEINLGRNKFVSFRGTLSGVYPALFTVEPDDKSFNGKTSYSYNEFLCGKVRVKPANIDG